MKTIENFIFHSCCDLDFVGSIKQTWIYQSYSFKCHSCQMCTGIFSLTYLRNYGAAFSILQNQQWFFTVITLAVVGAARYYFIKNINGNFWFLFGLLLIISGGIGNFIDRLRLGYVVDMVHLDFMNFAIFNVADSYLTVGVVILFIALWKEEENGINH